MKDYAYDPAAAKKMLADAGFSNGFETDIWAMPVQRPYNPNARRMAEIIQADWAKVGVKAQIVTYEWGEYLKRSKEGEHQTVLLGWTGDNGDPDNFLSVLLGCDAVGSANRARWCYKPFEDLIQKAKVTADVAERTRLYEEAQMIFKEQAPWVTIAHSVVFVPVRKEVQDFKIDPFGGFGFSGVDLTVDEGQVVGVVGESGSGKSVTQLALMGLIPYPGIISARNLRFNNHDVLAMSAKMRRSLIGKDIAMIFQVPMTSLNPCFTVGYQISETLAVHGGGSRSQRRERTIELLDQVGIPAPEQRLKSFPHQLSGGMNQRVMIAMAIACNPRLLVADEPTTALDVTIQAQILHLLLDLQRQNQMALILITHDMAVVAETVQQVVVMYAGQVVEKHPVDEIFSTPRHPYTSALLDALPERSPGMKRLPTIPGVVPGKYDRIDGCLFHPRCRFSRNRCRQEAPLLRSDGVGSVRCHFPLVHGAPQQ